MKSVGIVGLQGAGASTIFTALTQREGGQAAGAAQAVVAVPDARVDALAELSASKKRTYAQLRFVEASGRVRRGARGTGSLSAELLGVLRECDALVLVVKAFEGADPQSELEELALELALADAGVIGGRLERARKEAQAGERDAKRLVPLLERAAAALDGGTPLRLLDLAAEDRRDLLGLAPLTLKPVIVLANVPDEGGAGPGDAMAVAGRLEAELAGMEAAEAAELLSSFGHAERAIDRVIRAVYDRLALLTFLTTGPKESRAWEVRAGAPAPEAAAVIHSDMERGFIRAEICPYQTVVEAGGWQQAKAKGLVRQEGKSYQVQEGDVVEFRFAV